MKLVPKKSMVWLFLLFLKKAELFNEAYKMRDNGANWEAYNIR